MSLKQYRFADIFVFFIFAIGISFISEYVYFSMPIKYYYFNLSLLISLILIIRWGFIGAVAYALSGIPVLIYRGGNADVIFQIGFYIISNLSIGASVLTFKWMDKKRMTESFYRILVFLLTAIFCLVISKGFTLIFIGENPLVMSLQFFIGESFNFFITIVLFILINRLSDELIVDMTDYVYQIQGEKTQL